MSSRTIKCTCLDTVLGPFDAIIDRFIKWIVS